MSSVSPLTRLTRKAASVRFAQTPLCVSLPLLIFCVRICYNLLAGANGKTRGKDMKKGLILVNAYYTIPTYLNQACRLKEELEKLGVPCDIVRSDALKLSVVNGDVTLAVRDYSFCIYLDKDKYLSLMLEKTGLRLFNPHAAICACDDKMTTQILLAGSGVSMPDTVSGPLCFLKDAEVDDAFLDRVEDELGYPLIAKESYGSLGKGVYKIDDRDKLVRISKKLMRVPHLFQKYVATSYGKDVRVTVVGGKVVAAMKRQSDGDFRSNLELGGNGTPFSPDAKLTAASEKVAAILGLDYCGIDWLFGENGGFVLCEVNSNAFFGGIERVTGVNVGKAYAEHIFDTVCKNDV